MLQLLKKTRLVTITGEPGIGKTYIAKRVANYIAKRQIFVNKRSVMFMNVLNCSSKNKLIDKFIQQIKQETDFQTEDNKELMTNFNDLIRKLKDEFLLIIDDAEDLLKANKDMLKEFLEIIFEAAQIKILLTSKIELGAFLGGINGVSERVIKIQPLNLQVSEQLLMEKSGKLIPQIEKNALLSAQLGRGHRNAKSCYHDLFENILGGHPTAITIAANIYKNCTLKELYDQLSSVDVFNPNLQEESDQKGEGGFKTSLKLTLKLLNDKGVYILFNLIGYFPAGV